MAVAEFITENRGGHIGLSSPRADGPLKVADAARYAAEHNLPILVHGFPVLSTVAGGRIAAIRTEAAECVPGAVAVVTHKAAPEQAPFAESDDLIKGRGGKACAGHRQHHVPRPVRRPCRRPNS